MEDNLKDCFDCEWFNPEADDDEASCNMPEGGSCLMAEQDGIDLSNLPEPEPQNDCHESDSEVIQEAEHEMKLADAIRKAEQSILWAYSNCFSVEEVDALWASLSKSTDDFARLQLGNLGADYEAERSRIEMMRLHHPLD